MKNTMRMRNKSKKIPKKKTSFPTKSGLRGPTFDFPEEFRYLVGAGNLRYVGIDTGDIFESFVTPVLREYPKLMETSKRELLSSSNLNLPNF